MQLFRRSPEPWEIVESKAIDPVPTYGEDELEDMQIMRVYSRTMHRTYLFDLKNTSDLRRAVIFAQQKLLQEAAEQEFNVFLEEGWSVTHLRKGKRHRAEVRYTAKPAYASAKKSQPHAPPFLAMLSGRDSTL
ncbi:hypothetical protein BV20DRAFT_503089 [Pilatotrama ljubarskyi]|nr:hypothetical protein BV20DRAFT_503089 [Pilatotrama ljubarskyi]